MESGAADTVVKQQREVCGKYGVEHVPSPPHLKLGVAENVREGLYPLHGLRHPPEEGTTGWFIWAGDELSSDPDFFRPLHVEHLPDWCPELLRFLGLPPGWRFLVAPGHEDVWRDPELLTI